MMITGPLKAFWPWVEEQRGTCDTLIVLILLCI
jgi:hypothetical protein